MGRLDGKVAVITGASSGIGLRTAEIFAVEGAKIIVADRRVAEGEALAKGLGANCVFCQTDVTVEEQVRAMIALALDTFGRIDCLFNNAGILGQSCGIEGLGVEHFDRMLAVNVRGVMLGMKHAAPYMRKQGSGSIINTASISGRQAISGFMDYSAAKAAVIHLTKCVAMELGEVGVRVNSISPGHIATGIGVSDEAEKAMPVMCEFLKRAQPIPRAGLTEDVGYAAVFLASDESSFINGHDLVVDGGVVAGNSWSKTLEWRAEMRKAFEEHGIQR